MTAIEKFTFSLSFDDADNVIRSAGKEDEHYELGTKKKKKKEEEMVTKKDHEEKLKI